MEEPDRTLDATGLPCPLPVMKIMNTLNEMESGQMLQVVSDQGDIGSDARSVCERTGDELVSVQEEGGLFRALIRKV